MKRYAFVLSVFAIGGGIAHAQMGTPPTVVQQYTFAPIGIIAGQTLRVNLTNVATGSNAVCSGNLSFVNSDATSIKNENVTVNAGVTMSYTLVTSDVTGNPGSAEVRGVVKINRQIGPPMGGPSLPAAGQCVPVMSLELADANGTHVILTSPSLVSGGIVPILSSVPPMGPQ